MSASDLSPLGDVLGGLDADVERLFDVGLSSAAAAELVEALRRLEVLQRRLASGARRVLAEVDQRGVAGTYSAGSTRALLQQLLLIGPRDASARVAQARDFAPRVALTGEQLEPIFPVLAEALDSGDVSLAHARIISKTITDLPEIIEAEHGAAVETFLVEQAGYFAPPQLADIATRLIDTLNPDGKYTDEADHERRRHFSLGVHADGSATPSGHLSPELTAALRPVLDALSAPRPCGDLPDPRTPGQRRHDALLDMAMRLLRTGELPESGGCPATILMTVTDTTLAAGAGFGTDGYGTTLSLGSVLRLASEAEIIPVVLNITGGVLDYGRSRRLASVGQRRALAARDRGCSFPGCDCPAAWAEVHHIVEWVRGGDTDLRNLVLLCRFHHRYFQQAGWAVRMNADQIAEWIPPAWLDPDRKPRRNTLHDTPRLPELV